MNYFENRPSTSIYEILYRKMTRIVLVGLGYVGLSIALEFASYFKVVGLLLIRPE